MVFIQKQNTVRYPDDHDQGRYQSGEHSDLIAKHHERCQAPDHPHDHQQYREEYRIKAAEKNKQDNRGNQNGKTQK